MRGCGTARRAGLVSLALVFGDVVLIAASLGALAIVGMTHGRNFAVWALGMLVFTVGDIIYAYLLTVEAYRVGTLPDSLWVIGFSMIALGATGPDVPPAEERAPGEVSRGGHARRSSGHHRARMSPRMDTYGVPSVLALSRWPGAESASRWHSSSSASWPWCESRPSPTSSPVPATGARSTCAWTTSSPPRQATPAARRPSASPWRLVDLDRFKEVNDSLGHGSGDELLQAVVSRFADALDELDTPHLLTRLGGDEFAVVLDEVTTANDATIGRRRPARQPARAGRAWTRPAACPGQHRPGHGTRARHDTQRPALRRRRRHVRLEDVR